MRQAPTPIQTGICKSPALRLSRISIDPEFHEEIFSGLCQHVVPRALFDKAPLRHLIQNLHAQFSRQVVVASAREQQLRRHSTSEFVSDRRFAESCCHRLQRRGYFLTAKTIKLVAADSLNFQKFGIKEKAQMIT